MKPSSIRRFHKRTAGKEAGAPKKDNQEQMFFGTQAQETFFQPAPIQRKEEPKKEEEVKRAPDKKEEEVKRAAEAKEEEKVSRAPEKKEEEVKRAPEKKEEEVKRTADKKEEEVKRAPEAKEKEKVQKKESTATTTHDGGTTRSYISSINGKGQAMPKDMQAFYSRRMGYDFSNVRIHTGKDAESSAKDVSAKAYAYGNNIVFNEGQYNPNTHEGKKLMAHELTHVMQNNNAHGGDIQRQVEALPDVSQGEFDSCGAASLVAAIMIHDRQMSTGDVVNNSGFTAAANTVLAYYSMHPNAIKTGLAERRRITPEAAEEFYNSLRVVLLNARNNSREPGAEVSEADFQHLSNALYALHIGSRGGLSSAAIGSIRGMLGMTAPNEVSSGVDSYSSIISSPALSGLAPGQIAQIGWYVRAGAGYGHHAFLIGRQPDNSWFLYDQGTNPATRLTASSLGQLDGIIRTAVATGYWLFTGGISDFSSFVIGGWTGVTVLGSASGVAAVSTSFLHAGDRLGEVDNGYFTYGSDIIVEGYHSEYYDISSAQSAASGLSGSGGVIIEMPRGRFLLYTTSMVSDANRTETALDAADGGLFTETNRYFHAWLQLRSPAGAGSLISVY